LAAVDPQLLAADLFSEDVADALEDFYEFAATDLSPTRCYAQGSISG